MKVYGPTLWKGSNPTESFHLYKIILVISFRFYNSYMSR